MEVIAQNIANAQTTRTAAGGPYRRQEVVFEAAMAEVMRPGSSPRTGMHGVRVVEVVPDPSESPRVFNPGHPDADREGFLTLPNVQLPTEMVNMLMASRAYEANLKAAQAFRQMNEQALALLRS